jgi:hypothetical protein
MSTSSKKISTSGSAKSRASRIPSEKKRADLGLTAKEKIFVHALRELFRPSQGKSRELKPIRKEFCAQPSEKKSSGKATTKSQGSQKRTPKSKREKRTTYTKQTELLGKVAAKSPSKVRRAEKRRASQIKSKTYSPDIPITDVSYSLAVQTFREDNPLGIRNVVPLPSRSVLIRSAVEKLEKERVKERKLELAAFSLKKGVQELDVIEAWGGAKALDMMTNYVPKVVPTISWKPFVKERFLSKNHSIKHFDVLCEDHLTVVGSIKRDYTKAVLNVSASTSKRSLFLTKTPFPKSLKSDKGVEEKPKPTPMSSKTVNKSEKKQSPSRIRRKERRAQVSSEKKKKASFTKPDLGSRAGQKSMERSTATVESVQDEIASLSDGDQLILFKKFKKSIVEMSARYDVLSADKMLKEIKTAKSVERQVKFASPSESNTSQFRRGLGTYHLRKEEEAPR